MSDMQDGLTGLILATQNGFKDVVHTMLRNGADPNITEIVISQGYVQ